MTQYPEHEKQRKILEQSQVIGEFLDSCGYQLGVWRSGRKRSMDDEFYPAHLPISTILAEYFGIDLDKIEAEKREMLAETRAANL